MRGALDDFADAHRIVGKAVGRPDLRFQDDVDGTCLQRLDQRFRTGLRQRRAHHDRDRPLRHQLAQEGDAIHARHLDVERDDVRDLLLQLPRRHEGIGRHPHDLDIRILLQHMGQCLADAGGIVDDENADFLCHLRLCFRVLWKTVLETCFNGRSKPVIDSEWPMNM